MGAHGAPVAQSSPSQYGWVASRIVWLREVDQLQQSILYQVWMGQNGSRGCKSQICHAKTSVFDPVSGPRPVRQSLLSVKTTVLLSIGGALAGSCILCRRECPFWWYITPYPLVPFQPRMREGTVTFNTYFSYSDYLSYEHCM